MKLLIKLGGTLLDQPDTRLAIAAQVAEAARQHAVTVVHGGGKQMTRFLAERGVESQFINGLRVTSPDVIDAVLKVFAGSVNKDLVSALIQGGARAVGLSGIDGSLAVAEQVDPQLGAVGKIVRTNSDLLDVLVNAGFVPVVACVGGSVDGQIYNVNADQMAVACASGFQAAKLLFLTDVDGVMDASKTVLPCITPSVARSLIADGVATGGMQAKLESACAALAGGVGEVFIAPGASPNVVARLLAGETLGTRLVPEVS